MFLLSLANEVPPDFLTQKDGWSIVQNTDLFQRLNPRSISILEKVLNGASGIEKRHFALNQFERLFDLGPQELNEAFELEAPRLAKRALLNACDRAEVRPRDLDALFVCTCTGYICPGISSHVAEQTDMRREAFLQDIVGLGCGAAIPTLRTADCFLKAYPDARVAVIAVEICSAAFYIDNTPGVLISACLFGDGASASIWTGRDAGRCLLRGHSFQSLHLPEDRDLLRFENAGGKLRNRLDITVPRKAGSAVSTLWEEAARPPSTRVIAHSGGRDIIAALEKRLGCPALDESAHVLRNYGNMSSPSVLFALERHLETTNGGPKQLWLTSFGAGFAAHAFQLSSN